jgi:predicted unusual protein kinase regulating ubiquinone biosynthesis (AarF/ABC1/UbiB family)
MVNVMYELGMIDPEVSRSEIRDAAVQIMRVTQQARELEPRRIQEMVIDILNTFYTFPLMLPQELVYFFRAAALLEGIGFRYDSRFVGPDVVRPVVERMKDELLQSTIRAPGELARDLAGQAEQALRAVYDLVRRAEREELRVRAHPRDVLQWERFVGLMVRRLLLGIFASVMALVATLVFVRTGSWLILGVGNVVALLLFLLIFLVPKHLLENPLRHARGLRR